MAVCFYEAIARVTGRNSGLWAASIMFKWPFCVMDPLWHCLAVSGLVSGFVAIYQTKTKEEVAKSGTA